MSLRTLAKAVVPQSLLTAWRAHKLRKRNAAWQGLTTQQVFTKVYEDGIWGSGSDSHQFNSGSGSHNSTVVQTYVSAVTGFLQSLPTKPDVLDLGCGDFAVGSQIRPSCANYIAADIVAPVIAFNQLKYADRNVDFRTLDLTTDTLPKAGVLFLRQVLQHLSNAQIAAALPQITTNFQYLILTEHLPATATFTPNLDKPSGPDTRLWLQSGVILTQAPFNLQPLETRELCRVPELGGHIVTTLYRLV